MFFLWELFVLLFIFALARSTISFAVYADFVRPDWANKKTSVEAIPSYVTTNQVEMFPICISHWQSQNYTLDKQTNRQCMREMLNDAAAAADDDERASCSFCVFFCSSTFHTMWMEWDGGGQNISSLFLLDRIHPAFIFVCWNDSVIIIIPANTLGTLPMDLHGTHTTNERASHRKKELSWDVFFFICALVLLRAAHRR